MNKIALLDTSYRSENDGDSIIVDSVEREFPVVRGALRIPTHLPMGWRSHKVARNSGALMLTGTNILSRDIFNLRQWPLRPKDVEIMAGKVIFCGVGWWQYQHDVLDQTVAALKGLAYDGIPVAARDQYTTDTLLAAGIDAVNTSCPTMWRLPAVLPGVGHRDECVFTLTNYNPDTDQDLLLIDWLASRYQRVWVWPQSAKDERLFRKSRMRDRVAVLPRGLSTLATALQGRDYVGTRLHAGIRAAQLGSPMVILAVDNRAVEISKDTGLPVLSRNASLEDLNSHMDKMREPQDIRLPLDTIRLWKSTVVDTLNRAFG